jgi:hypothetical protein
MRASNDAQSTVGWEAKRHNANLFRIERSLLAGQMSAGYIRAVPPIDLTDDEFAAVTAILRRAIEDDRFPHAPPPAKDVKRARR